MNMPHKLLAEIYLSVVPFTHDASLYTFTVVQLRGLRNLVVASRAIVAKVPPVAMGTPEYSAVFGSHYHRDFPSFGSIIPPPGAGVPVGLDRRTCCSLKFSAIPLSVRCNGNKIA